MSRQYKMQMSVDLQTIHPEVTGSCILVVIRFPNGEKYKLLVDCGLFQEPNHLQLNEEPFPFKAENLDAVLVTHNHIDHIGRLPCLTRHGYCAPIMATEITAELIPTALGDTYKILATNARLKKTKPIYSQNDVQKTVRLIEGYPYEKPIKLHEHIDCCFLENGHVVGAGMILLQIKYPGEQDINFLFTGDYKRQNYFTGVAQLPEWVKKLPLHVVCESTYGEKSRNCKTIKCFKQNVANEIINGNSVVIPVFAFERGQVIFSVLKQIQEEYGITFPVFADSKLLFNYTQRFIRLSKQYFCEERCFFMPKYLTWVTTYTRAKFMQEDGAKVFVVTSGMGSMGPAQTYIPNFIVRGDASIHFTGYQCENTLGRTLQDEKGNFVKINGQMLKRRAQLYFTGEFTGHAKPTEIRDELLKELKACRTISLNHGTYKAEEDFAKFLISSNICKSVNILDRTNVFRFNAWGVTKVFPSKFS